MLITTPIRRAPRFPRVPATPLSQSARGRRRQPAPLKSTRRQAVGCRSYSSSLIGYAQTSATSHVTRQRGRHGAAGGRRALSRRLGVQPRPSPRRAGGARHEQASCLAFPAAGQSLRLPPPATPNFSPPPQAFGPTATAGASRTDRLQALPQHVRSYPAFPPQPPHACRRSAPECPSSPRPRGSRSPP